MGDGSAHDKALRLINFLRDYVQLGLKITRDVAGYERSGRVVWLHQIPQLDGSRCVLWDEQLKDTTWLEVQKPDLEDPPTPKLGLKPWVKSGAITAEPEIRDAIRVPNLADDQEHPAEIELRREAHPEIQEMWNDYLTAWRLWQYRNRNQLRVLEVYNRLYQTYRDYRRFSESMELVVGLGLATWRPAHDPATRRHLVTARAEIRFDRMRGLISVHCPAPPEGAAPQLEDEFLPRQIESDAKRDIQQALAEVGDAVMNPEAISPVLRAVGNELDPRNSISLATDPGDPNGQDLRIDFAPALVLRKRGVTGLLRVYDEISQQLVDGRDVPEGLADLLDPTAGPSADASPDPSPDPAGASTDETLYFPLLANDAQERIARSLAQRRGVLVQGPPGTGKSHTIANLISHELALGKRVLVTSETARALAVLKDMLPEELQPLCVSLLGASSEALAELTSSVNGMTERHAVFDKHRYEAAIDAQSRDLRKRRESLAVVEKSLLELREVEVRTHEINASYGGTPTAIARAVDRDRPRNEWFVADQLEEIPFTNEAGLRLLRGVRHLTSSRREELVMTRPSTQQLPKPDELETLFRHEETASVKADTYNDEFEDPLFGALLELEPGLRQALGGLLGEAQRHLDELEKRDQAWIDDATREAFSGDGITWETLAKKTDRFLQLEALDEHARLANELQVVLPDGKSADQVLDDARTMLRHLNGGGVWARLGVPSAPARGRAYLKSQVRIGSGKADSPESLRRLIDILEFKKSLNNVWRAWDGLSKPRSRDYEIQIAEIRANSVASAAVQSLRSTLTDIRGLLDRLQTSISVPWSPDGIRRLGRLVEAAHVQFAREESEQPLSELRGRLEAANQEGAHQVCSGLMRGLETRDLTLWTQSWATLAALEEDAKDLDETESLLAALAECASGVADELKRDPLNDAWDERLGSIEEAFAWAQAGEWVRRIGDQTQFRTLERSQEELGAQIRGLTAELAATKAWMSFLTRLTSEQSASLEAWSYAIKRIGKGTGKRAPGFRAEARRHMQVCAPAIPAWIMPRYRIPELMNIGQGMFDVAIVDEASQTGIDGLFLHYIADRIVVVGDDQQISPSGVGASQSEIAELQEKHLQGIFIRQFMDERTSLYDIAKILFASPSKLVLQEHFRCMPEIIHFSDGLCYRPYGTPLIPLRNYPPDRLPPLQSTYVEGGYQEGSGSSLLNEPEADALAETVAACAEAPEYEGKSMGVISLTGSRQAEKINQRLLDLLGPDVLEQRDLVCGDAYSFQGSERDVMFLSLVAAPVSNRAVAALVGDRYRQRFNVAASRAKDQMWLFHSANSAHLSPNPDCVRRALVEFFIEPNAYQLAADSGVDLAELQRVAHQPGDRGVPPKPFDSWFEVDVYLDLVDRNYRVVPQFHVANYRIDLVVEGVQARLAIECDGDTWHGPEQYASDVHRQRQLERAGWRFFRLRASEYYVDRSAAMAALVQRLTTLGVEAGVAAESVYESPEPAVPPSVEVPDIEAPAAVWTEPSQQGPSADEHVSEIQQPARTAGQDGFSATALDALFRWARGNVLIPVNDRILLADIEERYSTTRDLTDAETEDLARVYELARQRGFRPSLPN